MTILVTFTHRKLWRTILISAKSKYTNLLSYCNTVTTRKSGVINKTALYDFHVKHGGKMVNFGGYTLPVQYSDQNIIVSHLHTRSHASIFDVSHMLQTYIRGKDAIRALEKICTADLQNLSNGSGTLTVFTNNQGGILDDLIINRIKEDELYVVSNAAMKQQDQQLIESIKTQGSDIHVQFLSPDEQSLIALQGPMTMNILKKLTPETNLEQLYFMNTIEAKVAGVKNCRITRCGYTGEDGFEISVPSEKVQYVIECLFEEKEYQVKLAGLGARDSLRLEAGLCLYGHDINTETTPIEASLTWLVSKRRRSDMNFPGAHIIMQQIKIGVKRRRVGFKMAADSNNYSIKLPSPRAGTQIFVNNKCVGQVTSGCPSPSLGCNIAMGYIEEDVKQIGRKVQLKIRNQLYDANIVKMPFIETNYYMKK